VSEWSAAALADHLALAARIETLLPAVDDVAAVLITTFESGGTVYAFGNGGSAADAQHLAAELLGRFRRDRRPLAASALSTDPSTVTCIANDYAFDEVFARQVEALAAERDTVVGFTTSGSSQNVVSGLAAARERGAATVLFAGGSSVPASHHADFALVVPSSTTARIQEMHVVLLHLVIDQVDAWAARPRAVERLRT
jgi:D-sedoheptulose 7-phosphate isomerase